MKCTISFIKGFTLIELMITITIVAILAALAIPSYLNYTRRAYFTEIVSVVAPFKVGVLECYQTTGAITGCDAGTNNIPPAITTSTGNVASVSTTDGVITVTPVVAHGILASDNYILTPVITNNTVVWTSSGGGVTNGYAR